jgi:hypothetical protein
MYLLGPSDQNEASDVHPSTHHPAASPRAPEREAQIIGVF